MEEPTRMMLSEKTDEELQAKIAGLEKEGWKVHNKPFRNKEPERKGEYCQKMVR